MDKDTRRAVEQQVRDLAAALREIAAIKSPSPERYGQAIARNVLARLALDEEPNTSDGIWEASAGPCPRCGSVDEKWKDEMWWCHCPDSPDCRRITELQNRQEALMVSLSCADTEKFKLKAELDRAQAELKALRLSRYNVILESWSALAGVTSCLRKWLDAHIRDARAEVEEEEKK